MADTRAGETGGLIKSYAAAHHPGIGNYANYLTNSVLFFSNLVLRQTLNWKGLRIKSILLANHKIKLHCKLNIYATKQLKELSKITIAEVAGGSSKPFS